MKNLLVVAFFSLVAFSMPQSVFAQRVDLDELPKYVVLTVENTGLLGGISLDIQTKKSPYASDLKDLEHYLEDKREREVKTLTDLLNVMDELGYEFRDSFNARTGGVGIDTNLGGDTDLQVGSDKFRVNVIFQKRSEPS